MRAARVNYFQRCGYIQRIIAENNSEKCLGSKTWQWTYAKSAKISLSVENICGMHLFFSHLISLQTYSRLSCARHRTCKQTTQNNSTCEKKGTKHRPPSVLPTFIKHHCLMIVMRIKQSFSHWNRHGITTVFTVTEIKADFCIFLPMHLNKCKRMKKPPKNEQK